jgi:hypothetical protein
MRYENKKIEEGRKKGRRYCWYEDLKIPGGIF